MADTTPTQTSDKVGQKIVSTIEYVDTNGNVMPAPTTFDVPPSWSAFSAESAETLSVSADGATATWTAVNPGTNTVTLTLTVGGQQFTATAVHTVTAATTGQTLGSIRIVETVSN